MQGRSGKPASGLLMVIGGILLAALIAGLVRNSTPKSAGPEVKPNVWPWIDVAVGGGKPFGTIRVAQPVQHEILSHGLIAAFVPADGRPLSEVAATLWPGVDPKYLHFNWIQTITNSGNPPTPLDSSGQPLFAPFLDPPAKGYQHDPKPADELPWYLDENPYAPPQSAAMNIHNPDVMAPTVLNWYAKPYSTALPDAIQYDTLLVLVNDQAHQYQPLGGFHWTAVFPVSGEPTYKVSPFLSIETFQDSKLIADFGKPADAKLKTPGWTLRPAVKP